MNAKPLEPRVGQTTARGGRAILHLDGQPVGDVVVQGWDGSWGFGTFLPGERFSDYAPIFGTWSLLMHADGDDQKLSDAASQELIEAESRLDTIKSKLFFPKNQQWVDIAELNIDAEMLEWKEY
jgi:hypothetical protein